MRRYLARFSRRTAWSLVGAIFFAVAAFVQNVIADSTAGRAHTYMLGLFGLLSLMGFGCLLAFVHYDRLDERPPFPLRRDR